MAKKKYVLPPLEQQPFDRLNFRVGKLAAAIRAEHDAAEAYISAVADVRLLNTQLVEDDSAQLESVYKVIAHDINIHGELSPAGPHWLTQVLDKQKPDWWCK